MLLVTGSTLLELLIGCPCDAYPKNVSDDEDTGTIFVNRVPVAGIQDYVIRRIDGTVDNCPKWIDAEWEVILVKRYIA